MAYHTRVPGEAVTAVVAREPGSDLDELTIIDHYKTELAGFKTPKKVIILDKLPTTATGKVKKHVLRAEYAEMFAS